VAVKKITIKLRAKLGNIKLRRELLTHRGEHNTVNFEEAKKIGILYDATEVHDYEFIRNYVKTLRSATHKDVLALGYVDKKTLPHGQFAQYGLDFFTRKQLNFHLFPSNPIVTNFINEKFDILISFANTQNITFNYIVAMSKAKFRVGRFDKKSTAIFDLMLNVKKDISLKEFSEEVESFLKKIRTN
jgi:phosphoribulokinase